LAAIEVANYEVDLCLRWSERGTDHRVSHSSLLGACDKVKLEGKAKEELKVRDGRGGCVWSGIVVQIDTYNMNVLTP